MILRSLGLAGGPVCRGNNEGSIHGSGLISNALFPGSGMLQSIMLIIPYRDNTRDKIISESLDVLKKGGVIAYPTESFYALGVAATDENAVKKLFALKKRPADKALPLIVGDRYMLITCIHEIPLEAEDLIKRFWPGPLTLIFKAKEHIPKLLTGNTGKVAIRIPGESAALHLVRELKLPITATSANPSSMPPADSADKVIDYYEDKIDLIIDAGKSAGGKPSTIIDVTVSPPKVLREGSVSL